MRFASWFRSYTTRVATRTAEIRSHRYVYAGGHPALVHEVEDHYVHSFQRREVTSFDCDQPWPWHELERVIARILPNRTKNVVVLRRAEALPADVWGRLARWALHYGPHHVDTFILALGDAPWVTTLDVKTKDRPRNDLMREDPRFPLFCLEGVGCYVDCSPLSHDAQVMWAHRRTKGRLAITQTARRSHGRKRRDDRSPAATLVELCSGDLSRLRSELTKLDAVTTGLISADQVRAFVHRKPGEEFVDALTEGNKVQAVRAAPLILDPGPVLSLLDSTCADLFLLREAQRVLGWDKPLRELANYVNFDIYRTLILRDRCRTFTREAVLRRYAAIIQTRRRLSAGAPSESVLTVLAAEW